MSRTDSESGLVGDRWLVAGCVGLLLVSLIPTFFAPLLSHSLSADRGLATSTVGALISANQGGLAVGVIGSALIISRVPRLWWGVGGATIAVIGWVVASTTHATSALAVVLVVIGLASGAASAAGNASLATARQSVRAFAAATIATVIIGSTLIAIVPQVDDKLPLPAAAAPFAVAATAAALATVAVLVVSPARLALTESRVTTGDRRQVTVPSTSGTPVRAQGLVFLGAILCVNVGNFAIWTFAENIGIAAGLNASQAGLVLGLTQVTGLLGAFFTGFTGSSARRLKALPLFVIALAVGNAAVGLAVTGAWFVVGMQLLNLAYYAMTPVFYGTAARLDTSGRLPALVAGAGLVAGFIAPNLAAAAAGPDDNWMRLTGVAVALILITVPIFAVISRRHRGALAPANDLAT